jgi:outer membrane immunogenic protein
MKTKLCIGMVAAGLTALSGVALADGYAGGGPVARPFSWTGIYVGAQGGFGEARADYFVPATSFDQFFPISGGFIGGMVGANYQIGALVVGVQGEWNAADINGSQFSAVAAPGGATFAAKLDDFGSVDGRVGIAVGRALGYVIGGYAWGDPRGRVTLANGSFVNFDGGDKHGWDAGFGLEYAFWGGFTARIEYRHYDFGSVDVGALPIGGATLIAHTSTMERFDTARVGLAYKFGAGDYYAPLK